MVTSDVEIVEATIELPEDETKLPPKKKPEKKRKPTRTGWKYFAALFTRLAIFSVAMAASFAVTVRSIPSLQYSVMTELLRFEEEQNIGISWIKWGLGFADVSASPSFLFSYLQERESSTSYIRENQIILKTVLAAGVDPDIKNSEGKFPLEITIDRGLDPYTEILISAGANPCERFADGTTVLHHIAERSFLSLQSLLSKIQVKCPNEINMITPTGESPLSLAVATNNKRAVKELIAVGARIDTEGVSSPPLHSAVNKSRPELAKLLIKEGADLNDRDAKGDTPLMRAITLGKEKLAEKLLQAPSIDISIPNHQGATPLMIALAEKHTRLVPTLLLFNTDLTAQDRHGNSIVDYAVDYGKIEVLETVILSIERNNPDYFEANRRELLRPLFFAIAEGDLDRFRLCLALGASRNDLDAQGVSALMRAVEFGRKEIVEDILEHAKNTLNLTDFSGRSAIYYAQDAEMFNFLLAAGANPIQRMFGDRTLIQHYVTEARPKTLIWEVIAKFPKMKNWTDVAGMSASQIAQGVGKSEVHALLK